ncbi:SRPBCC family protein [Dokdonella sp.]|uniref:SRPBCC family protein n=1 Tax=Dokdonella sp. TaxID=2291710 RepID=UPI003C33DA04
MTNSITKEIEISAPVSRVWQALTDHEQFEQWFRIKLEGPFRLQEITRGKFTHPGFEHVKWEATVTAIEPEHRFAFTWHPYAVEANTDYSKEEPTLVEFTLQPTSGGTLLRVVESGFDKIPAGRRPEALRMNTHGWETQMKNIKQHVE